MKRKLAIIAAHGENGQFLFNSYSNRPAFSDARQKARVGPLKITRTHQCGNGINNILLLLVSTTTARFSFASIATENCWFCENCAELGKPNISRVWGAVHVTGKPGAGGHA
jgi:hypothetical protein